MQLNGMLAAPGFEQWFEGEPLDPASLLRTADGKPRVSIFSIAHLGDAERMFFVSLLLNQIVGWMRAQTGTSSLRAIVYMDEIAGYFPPVANPPSKAPLLTLLKQARAFGVGVVLATQNPVDLDYKGLSNTGTWFLGRLRPSATRRACSTGWKARRPARSTAPKPTGSSRPRQARVPAAQRSRAEAGRLSDPLDDVVSARGRCRVTADRERSMGVGVRNRDLGRGGEPTAADSRGAGRAAAARRPAAPP